MTIHKIKAKYESIHYPYIPNNWNIFELEDGRFTFINKDDGEDEIDSLTWYRAINTADHIIRLYDQWAKEDIECIQQGGLAPYWEAGGIQGTGIQSSCSSSCAPDVCSTKEDCVGSCSPKKIEEECGICHRMKDAGDKCWCCGN
jgi:hypothetical protein